MADRRRINGPVGVTLPPIYDSPPPQRAREGSENAVRKTFLETGMTPSASGSAYLELRHPDATEANTNFPSLKLTCTVHGPRALPRSAPFSPHVILTTHVKYAPFATKHRRGYLRDFTERDLSVHLETALRGAIIADRWPKSGVDVIVTIIEGDQDRHAPEKQYDDSWDSMNVLSGCINVASAAIADAGIDCVDTVAGGVAALVTKDETSTPDVVTDPVISEYHKIDAACCIAYLPTRDEVTNIWFKGKLPAGDVLVYNTMVERCLSACRNSNGVILAALKKTVDREQEGS